MNLQTQSGGFTARLLADGHNNHKQHIYQLNHALPSGEQEYIFVLVEDIKDKAFQRALSGSDQFAIEDYGMIVGRGTGEPSDELKARIAEAYQVIFN